MLKLTGTDKEVTLNQITKHDMNESETFRQGIKPLLVAEYVSTANQAIKSVSAKNY
jgi:hypothetical protein